MKESNKVIPIIILLMFSLSSMAQESYLEGGFGIGNVLGSTHRSGKAELHIGVFKGFPFGELGLDLSGGGNFIPGTNSIEEPGVEILSPNDVKFASVMLLYRFPLIKNIFIEPRLGYTALNVFVHTTDITKLRQDNISAGIGIGVSLDKIALSLRYQYNGETSDYEGLRDAGTVKSFSEPVSMILLRMSYHLELNKRN